MDYFAKKKIGEELIRQDNYPEAIVIYLELFKENPNDIEVIEKIIFLYSRIHQGNLEFVPKTAEHFVMRGISRFHEEQFNDSVNDYSEAIKLDPKCDLAYKSRAYSLWFLDKREEAISDIEQAIALYPIGEYYDDLGGFYAWAGDNANALIYHKKAVETTPDSARLWYNYGVELMEDRQIKEALKAYDKAIELWPLYDDALYNRKFILDNFPNLK
jgi:tetratricopeptide (TPR) repeat protein